MFLISIHHILTFVRSKVGEGFGGVTWFTGNADAIGPPDELHGLFIDSHQFDGVDVGQDLAVEATRSNLPGNRSHPPQRLRRTPEQTARVT